MKGSYYDIFRHGVTAIALCFSSYAGAEGGLPVAAFPLGRSDLPEIRERDEIAAGVTLHTIRRGAPGGGAGWVLSAGIARTSAERARAANCIRNIGLAAEFQTYRMPGTSGRAYVEVTGGRYRDERSAQAFERRARGCVVKARAIAASPLDRAGPWLLHIVEIQPRLFQGRLLSTLGQRTAQGRETVSMIARRTGALVAVNGGFFAMHANEGVVGEPAGIAVIDGRLRSEPTAGRPYLLLSGDRPARARIVTDLPAAVEVKWDDGTSTVLNGVDREPGVVRNCGMIGVATPSAPVHDKTCRPTDDLVVITPDAGFLPKADAVLVGADGRLHPARPPQTGEVLLAGAGRGPTLLAAKLKQGARAVVDLSFSAGAAGDHSFAVNGGPLLLHRGKVVRRDDREGWDMADVPLARANIVHHWTTLRNPRTAVGVGSDDRIWLVVVEGRELAEAGSVHSAVSAGLSIDELRAVMAHLDARDAINLDGGGSSMLVVDGKPMFKPSDRAGERAIGDAIVLVP